VPDFPGFAVARAGAILAVSDFAASLRFYRDQLGPVARQGALGVKRAGV